MFLFQDLVKTLPVLRCVHPLGSCSEDRNAHLHEGLREADGRLPAELHDRSIRLLEKNDIPDIFGRERLKIEPVSNVKICRDRLRVIVYDDRLISLFLEGPCRVHAAEIKLDPLTDPDRAAAEDEDLLSLGTVICSFLCCLLRKFRAFRFRKVFSLFGSLSLHDGDFRLSAHHSITPLFKEFRSLVHSPVNGIKVWRLRLELRRAGIDHLKGRKDPCLGPEPSHLRLLNTRETADHRVRKLEHLGCPEKVSAQMLVGKPSLHLHEQKNLVEEPCVDSGQRTDLRHAHSPAEGFCNKPDPPVIRKLQMFPKVVIV